VRLPADYKLFLLEHNGGDPAAGVPDSFALSGRQDEHGTLVTFYSFVLGVREPCTLPHAWDENENWFPRELWPIADDASGNYVALVLGGDSTGRVVYLESDLLTLPEASIDALAEQPGFVPIADSFTEFITSLVEHP